MSDDQQLPAPLTPPDSNLANFLYMPLDVQRLRDSKIASVATGDGFRTAVLLWCAAWHQRPAGSLPDDDRELASLAGYGRVVEAFTAIKKEALWGWFKCSDGRLYHPVVCEKANEAWQEKLQHAWSREKDRIRKENKAREERSEPPLPTPAFEDWNKARLAKTRLGEGNLEGGTDLSAGKIDVSAGNPAETTRKGREGKGREGNISLGASAAAPPAAPMQKKKASREEHPRFAEFWSEYPKRAGTNPRKPASERFSNALAAGADPDDIIAGTKLYAAKVKRMGKVGTEYVKQAVAFLNQEIWADELREGAGAPAKPPADDREAEQRLSVARSRRQWPSAWGPMPGQTGCLIPPHLLSPGDGVGWKPWTLAAVAAA